MGWWTGWGADCAVAPLSLCHILRRELRYSTAKPTCHAACTRRRGIALVLEEAGANRSPHARVATARYERDNLEQLTERCVAIRS